MTDLSPAAQSVLDAAISQDGEPIHWSGAYAAIREVAAWLREQHDGDPVAATVLEKEASK